MHRRMFSRKGRGRGEVLRGVGDKGMKTVANFFMIKDDASPCRRS